MNEYELEGKEYLKTYSNTMPLKIKDVKVVIVSDTIEYGIPPATEFKANQHFGLKALRDEYNRTSGRVEYRFYDFKAWKNQGILMLDYRRRNKRNILHYLRLISLTNKNVVFVFVGDDPEIIGLSTFLSDNSDESNFFFWYKGFPKNSMFTHVDQTRKFLKQPPINWSPV